MFYDEKETKKEKNKRSRREKCERGNEKAELCRMNADRETLEWAWNIKKEVEKWDASNPTTFEDWREWKINEELELLEELKNELEMMETLAYSSTIAAEEVRRLKKEVEKREVLAAWRARESGKEMGTWVAPWGVCRIKKEGERWDASNPTAVEAWKLWKLEKESEKWMNVENRLADARYKERKLRRYSIGCRLLAVVVGILVLAGVETEFGDDNGDYYFSVLGFLLVALMNIDFLLDYQKLMSRLHKDELLHAAKVAYEYVDHLARHPETPKNPEKPWKDKLEFEEWYYAYNPDKQAEHTWSDYAYKSCVLDCYNHGESSCKRALRQHPLYPSARFTFILFVAISIVCFSRWGFLVSFFHILLMSFSIVALVGSFYHEIEYYVRNTNSVW